MRAIFAAIETDRCDPFVNKARVLPGAEVAHIVDPAWEDEIEDRAATALQPFLQAPACLRHDLELNWPAGLLLDNRRAVADLAAADDVTDPELNEITAAQLAVDRKIEQCAITQAFMFVEKEANGPNISRFERALWADILSCVPGAPLVNGGVKI